METDLIRAKTGEPEASWRRATASRVTPASSRTASVSLSGRAERHLHERVIAIAVVLAAVGGKADGGDAAGENVVQAEAFGALRREDHVAGGYAHAHGRAGVERAARHEQRAAGERERGEAAVVVDAVDVRVEDTSGVERVGVRRGGERPRQIGAARHLLDRTGSDDAAAIEQQQVRGEPHDIVEIVRDQYDRDADAPAKFVELVVELPTHGAIDGGEGFVEQHDVRIARERPRQCDPLTLSARERGRLARFEPLQMDQRQPPIRLILPFSAPADPPAPPSRCRARSNAGTARNPETPTPRAADTSAHSPVQRRARAADRGSCPSMFRRCRRCGLAAACAAPRCTAAASFFRCPTAHRSRARHPART